MSNKSHFQTYQYLISLPKTTIELALLLVCSVIIIRNQNEFQYLCQPYIFKNKTIHKIVLGNWKKYPTLNIFKYFSNNCNPLTYQESSCEHPAVICEGLHWIHWVVLSEIIIIEWCWNKGKLLHHNCY